MSKRRDRQHRGFRYPVPIDGYPPIDVCFQIPDHPFYRAAVRGLLKKTWVYWNWYNDGVNDLQQRWDVGHQFQELIDSTLQFGECIALTEQLQVRTDPTDACLLEYSPDGGMSWIQFADISQCQTIAGSAVNNDTVINNMQVDLYLAQYDGTPGSINPDAPTGTWDEGGDIDRDIALCMAAQAFVGSYAARKVQELDRVFAGFFVFLVGVALLTGGIGIIAGMALGGASLVGGWSYLVARAALLDETALQAVACCMYDALKGQTVSEAVFVSSLDTCGFTPGSNEAIVRDFVADSIQHQESYLAMIDATGRTWTQLTVFGVNECNCDVWEHTFLGGAGGAGAWVPQPYTNPSSNQCAGTYNAGMDRFDGCNAGSGFAHNITIKATIPATVITHVEFRGSGHETRSSASDNLFIYLNGSPVASKNEDIDWIDSVVDWDGVMSVTDIELFNAAALNGGAGVPFSYIDQIIIRGRGVDPF